MTVQTALFLPSTGSKLVENATKAWLKKHCEVRVFPRRLSPPDTEKLFVPWVAETFSETAAWIENQAASLGGPSALRNFACYVEAYDPDVCGWEDIRPLSGTRGPQTALVWMLILAFPEVHWIFYTPYSIPSCERFQATSNGTRFSSAHLLTSIRGLDGLWRLHRAGFAPLFDPIGIRELIRDRLRHERVGEQCLYSQLPRRPHEAIALDEESEYAFFTAYLAYRYGFRSWAIPSMELMGWRLEEADVPGPIALSLEDVFLSFPDRSFEQELSNLEKRYLAFKALAHVEHRVLITVGRGLAEAGGENAARNREYLKEIGKPFRVIYKPLTGVFETAHKAGLRKMIDWPPARQNGASDFTHGHSAPGRPMAVARVLLTRAQTLLNSDMSVQDAIHASVLALDAKELLGGRTPTLALRAISLQQEAEIAAESLFLGMQHNLDVERRLRDIKSEVAYVGRWVHPSQKRRSVLNARLSIAEQLAKRYHDLNQIEEESACLAEARKLRFDFWVLESPVRWPLWPVLRYLSFSLSSIGRFIGIVATWTIFFGLSYYIFGKVTGKPNLYLGDAMASSARLFFTGSNSTNWDTLRSSGTIDGWEVFWRYWIMFQSIVSFTNLGLLLSHLYMIVSRR